MDLEAMVKSQRGERYIVIKAKDKNEFRDKRDEYLKTHPEPEFFIFLTYDDGRKKGIDRE